MNIHKHARLTFARRQEMVQQMTLQGLSAVQAAAVQGVTPQRPGSGWVAIWLEVRLPLPVPSSMSASSPRAIDPFKALLIIKLRKRRMLQARIARRCLPAR